MVSDTYFGSGVSGKLLLQTKEMQSKALEKIVINELSEHFLKDLFNKTLFFNEVILGYMLVLVFDYILTLNIKSI